MDTPYTLSPNELGQVPLALIDRDPNQPRKSFDATYIKQLAEEVRLLPGG